MVMGRNEYGREDEGGRDVGGMAGGRGVRYDDWACGWMLVGRMRMMGVCGVWLMREPGTWAARARRADGLD